MMACPRGRWGCLSASAAGGSIGLSGSNALETCRSTSLSAMQQLLAGLSLFNRRRLAGSFGRDV